MIRCRMCTARFAHAVGISRMLLCCSNGHCNRNLIIPCSHTSCLVIPMPWLPNHPILALYTNRKNQLLTSARDSPYRYHQTPTPTYSSAAWVPRFRNCFADPSIPSSRGSSAVLAILCVEGTYAAPTALLFRSLSVRCCIWCLWWCRRTSVGANLDDCCGRNCPRGWQTVGVQHSSFLGYLQPSRTFSLDCLPKHVSAPSSLWSPRCPCAIVGMTVFAQL